MTHGWGPPTIIEATPHPPHHRPTNQPTPPPVPHTHTTANDWPPVRRYGAIVGGQDRIVKLPRGGGVMGMAPSACAIDTHLSCFPSIIDALAAGRNVSRLVSICGNEVCVWGGEGRWCVCVCVRVCVHVVCPPVVLL
jgi:hypothetical protein